MARLTPDPDWLEALRRPTPGLALGDQSAAQRFLPPVCTRCRRPGELRESWLERRRLRSPDPASPGGFRYGYAIKEHLLCGPCYQEVRRGQPPTRTHALKIMAAVVAGAVALAAGLPLAMPNLMSAFWRTGAAPGGWHEGHAAGRRLFVPGRP